MRRAVVAGVKASIDVTHKRVALRRCTTDAAPTPAAPPAVPRRKVLIALAVTQWAMMGVAGRDYFVTLARDSDAAEAASVMDAAGSLANATEAQADVVRKARTGVVRSFITGAATCAAVASFSFSGLVIAAASAERLVAVMNAVIGGTSAITVDIA